jgi:hypothetical protein
LIVGAVLGFDGLIYHDNDNDIPDNIRHAAEVVPANTVYDAASGTVDSMHLEHIQNDA